MTLLLLLLLPLSLYGAAPKSLKYTKQELESLKPPRACWPPAHMPPIDLMSIVAKNANSPRRARLKKYATIRVPFNSPQSPKARQPSTEPMPVIVLTPPNETQSKKMGAMRPPFPEIDIKFEALK